MKNYYKAEYNGQTFVRASAAIYTAATIWDFKLIPTKSGHTDVAIAFHARADLAGKKLNGCYDATTVVAVVEITAAEYKAIKAGE